MRRKLGREPIRIELVGGPSLPFTFPRLCGWRHGLLELRPSSSLASSATHQIQRDDQGDDPYHSQCNADTNANRGAGRQPRGS